MENYHMTIDEFLSKLDELSENQKPNTAKKKRSDYVNSLDELVRKKFLRE